MSDTIHFCLFIFLSFVPGGIQRVRSVAAAFPSAEGYPFVDAMQHFLRVGILYPGVGAIARASSKARSGVGKLIVLSSM